MILRAVDDGPGDLARLHLGLVADDFKKPILGCFRTQPGEFPQRLFVLLDQLRRCFLFFPEVGFKLIERVLFLVQLLLVLEQRLELSIKKRLPFLKAFFTLANLLALCADCVLDLPPQPVGFLAGQHSSAAGQHLGLAPGVFLEGGLGVMQRVTDLPLLVFPNPDQRNDHDHDQNAQQPRLCCCQELH